MDRTAAPEQPRKKHSLHYVAAVAVLLLVLGAFSLLHVVIGSPIAASKTSETLTRIIRQPVSIGRLSLHFPALTIENLVIGNPPGFSHGNLATVRSVTVTPLWTDILTGRTSFESIVVKGLTVSILRHRDGNGNFSPLLQAFSSKKGGEGGTETRIRKFVLEPAIVTVNGSRIDHVSVNVTDIATRGSAVAAIDATARIPAGEITLKGTVRPGRELSANLFLDAPSLAMERLIPARPHGPQGGSGSISAKVHVDTHDVIADIAAEFRKIMIPFKGEFLPLAGSTGIRLRYDRQADRLRMNPSTLQINHLVAMTATGIVEEVRGERKFAVNVATAPVSIRDVAAQVPPRLRGHVELHGEILPIHFTATGDVKHGVLAAEGVLAVRDGGADKAGKVIVRQVDTRLVMEKKERKWLIRGAVGQANVGDGGILQGISGNFKGELSDRMKPVLFEVPQFKATLAGNSVTGSASYDTARPVPLQLSATITEIPLAALNPFLAERATFTGGTASVSLNANGINMRRFEGSLRAHLGGASGTVGQTPFSVGSAGTSASFARNGEFTASGAIDLQKWIIAGKPIAGSFRYFGSNEVITLEAGKVAVDGVDYSFQRIDGKVLYRKPQSAVPLRIEFAGVDCVKGDVGAMNSGGYVDAILHLEGEHTRLEGRGEIRGCDLFLRRRKVASIGSRFSLGNRSTDADVEGMLFGGRLKGKGHVDLSGPSPTALFVADVKGAAAADISALAGGNTKMAATAGVIDVSLTGGYARDPGVSARATFNGTGISLVGESKRTILSDTGFTVEGSLAGNRLRIGDGRIRFAPETSMSFTGEVVQPFSSGREGDIHVRLPVTPTNALFDTVLNALPRKLQEASLSGSIGADSVIGFRGPEVKVDGKLVVTDSSLDLPSQNLSVSGIRGTVPFSFVSGAPSGKAHREEQHPSRESYAGYLQFLQVGPHRGTALIVDRVRFGALELGQTVMQLEAAEGQISVNSFHSSLAEGIIVGRGYYRPGNDGSYGGDMLVNNLSLRAFCASFPAIKGYISGRLDGIASVVGTGKGGTAGTTGLTQLWARKTKNEKMLVSREFLQKLAGKNLQGIFFRDDRPYDRGEISASLQGGYLTFSTLDISNTNFFGIRDLSVTVAPEQNRIAIDHLVDAVRQAAARGKAVKGTETPETPVDTEFKWEE